MHLSMQTPVKMHEEERDSDSEMHEEGRDSDSEIHEEGRDSDSQNWVVRTPWVFQGAGKSNW